MGVVEWQGYVMDRVDNTGSFLLEKTFDTSTIKTAFFQLVGEPMFSKINLIIRSLYFVLILTSAALSTGFSHAGKDDEASPGEASSSDSDLSATLGGLSLGETLGTLTREGVMYTQELSKNRVRRSLGNEDDKSIIERLWKASISDDYKTHLLARGFSCTSNDNWHDDLSMKESFLGAGVNLERVNPSRQIEWVSSGSKAISNNDYYIRKSFLGNGHAELQLIDDLNKLFVKNSDAVVEYFMPDKDDKSEVYMCGLEIFGSYDMCNDCAKELCKFRKNNQCGNSSISKAIRDKLGDRFEGNRSDAFVVIYNAKFPYVDSSYRVHMPLPHDLYNDCKLKYSYGNGKKEFIVEHEIDGNIKLSQLEKAEPEQDFLYCYIHELGNKKVSLRRQ